MCTKCQRYIHVTYGEVGDKGVGGGMLLFHEKGLSRIIGASFLQDDDMNENCICCNSRHDEKNKIGCDRSCKRKYLITQINTPIKYSQF